MPCRQVLLVVLTTGLCRGPKLQRGCSLARTIDVLKCSFHGDRFRTLRVMKASYS